MCSISADGKKYASDGFGFALLLVRLQKMPVSCHFIQNGEGIVQSLALVHSVPVSFGFGKV